MAHSITSSARNSKDCGIVVPIAFAALRLTVSWNFVGRSIGRSPGRAPCTDQTAPLHCWTSPPAAMGRVLASLHRFGPPQKGSCQRQASVPGGSAASHCAAP
jgi:hypothetical protein